ncbi:alpha amylase C-terminal domain-containing protein, partial [Francisella tularensis subsp. holarctica]|nr:alpha amylase C-terminal domain-containing protein [Francisella tularensis subsp. holarctica]
VEWRECVQLQWQGVDKYDYHKHTLHFLKKLNEFYHNETALWHCDYDHHSFNWIDANNSPQSILYLLRDGKENKQKLFFICNFNPDTYSKYHLILPDTGSYKDIFK